MSALLAQEFSRLDHEVTVVTQTSDRGEEEFHFPIVRRPSLGKLFGLIKCCDVFWQNNLSLRTFWPALFLRKPVVITHQGSYCRLPAGFDVGQRLKHAVTNRFASVAISQFVASCFRIRSTIIPNPYDASIFHNASPVVERSGDLVFVGRLVSEKGLDVLLESLNRLRSRELRPQLTIVGGGPEERAMQELTRKFDLYDQVAFVGPKRGGELADILNRHKILVVPSRYDEPFGVVALEGIACGCAVIGSNGGGLPEAIGPCGVTFPNGETAALADALEKLLKDPEMHRRLNAKAPEHLARFHPTVIANAYLNLFQSKIQ